MARVVWSDAALSDLQGIFDFIAGQNSFAAINVSKDLLLAGDSLACFPRRGKLRSSRLGRELVSVRPYVPVYDIHAGNVVRILRVWHAAQDRS